jgi:DNA-binding NtrC family response regulator
MASVLIIHERSDICNLLSPAIESHGHKCRALTAWQDAVLALKTTPFDIIILDMDITGKPDAIVRTLVNSEGRPHVLVITSGSDPVILEETIRAGAWDVICVPFTQDELGQAINRCMNHRTSKMEFKKHFEIKRDAIIGGSRCMEQCLSLVATAAQSKVNVLIHGETGTGKELFARAIHENSNRAKNSFIVVDCTNIHKILAEGLSFGHERGACISSAKSQGELFRQAQGGTLFLDEIGDLDIEMQKLLRRALQEPRVHSMNSEKTACNDFRMIATTSHNLEALIKRGEFRKDLYYRLSTCVIGLPPLRQRKEDILTIASYHLRQICSELGCDEKEVSDELHHALTLYDWPGNVRELINVMYAIVQKGLGECRLYPQHLPIDIRTKILLKRSHRPHIDGYLVATETAGCSAEDNASDWPLLSPAQDADPHASHVDTDQEATAKVHFAPEKIIDSQTEHKPVNGFELIESFNIASPLSSENDLSTDLLPLRAVRELTMQNVEAAYMKRLVATSRGNFRYALAISGLSRARLYDLLNKHSMSISGN